VRTVTDAHADAVSDLGRELRADAPPSVAALSADELRHLTAALAGQRKAQLRAADAAIADGLGFLPRVLRTVVRRTLMG
jgi:hypothetical protein